MATRRVVRGLVMRGGWHHPAQETMTMLQRFLPRGRGEERSPTHPGRASRSGFPASFRSAGGARAVGALLAASLGDGRADAGEPLAPVGSSPAVVDRGQDGRPG